MRSEALENREPVPPDATFSGGGPFDGLKVSEYPGIFRDLIFKGIVKLPTGFRSSGPRTIAVYEWVEDSQSFKFVREEKPDPTS